MPHPVKSSPGICGRTGGSCGPWSAVMIGGCLLVGRAAAAAEPVADPTGRQRQAVAALAQLPDAVELPTGGGVDLLGGGAGRIRPALVDLGALPVADLVEPAFRLAVCDDPTTGRPFAASIMADEQYPGRWEIRQATDNVGLDGRAAGSLTLATLVAKGGRLALEVPQRADLERHLASLRRCVILAEARHPETGRLLLKELRLVRPTRLGSLTIDPLGGRQTLLIPVPFGISIPEPGVEAGARGSALPLHGVEVEGQWGDQRVTLRLPEDAAGLAEPGVGAWAVNRGPLAEGVSLSLAVTLSLPQAELSCLPSLTGPAATGRNLADFAAVARGDDGARQAVRDAFFSRIDACPVKAHDRRNGDLTRDWFETPLATMTRIGITPRGHETIRKSLDIYLKAEYQSEADRLKERWETKLATMPDTPARRREEYFGPRRPGLPRNFDEWRRSWNSTREADWEIEFSDRLRAWSHWFWSQLKNEWAESATKIARVLQEPIALKLMTFTSIARDSQGHEYRVPLVVFDLAAGAAGRPAAGEAGGDVGHSPRGGASTSGFE
jgi:hypothetical protein